MTTPTIAFTNNPHRLVCDIRNEAGLLLRMAQEGGRTEQVFDRVVDADELAQAFDLLLRMRWRIEDELKEDD